MVVVRSEKCELGSTRIIICVGGLVELRGVVAQKALIFGNRGLFAVDVDGYAEGVIPGRFGKLIGDTVHL
jgi:hypothetical protein